MDEVCDCGFTFESYKQNQPASKDYLRMGLLPLCSRLSSLFDTFKDEYHEVNFDNMYSSEKNSFAAYVKHKKKVW